MAPPRAVILGLAGPRLSAEEAALWRKCPPLGAILFARNIQDPAQLRALTHEIRDVLGEAAPILIDQEGGRVARLKPPHWEAFPAAARFEALPEMTQRANALLLGRMCRDAGLDVVCAPVLDLRLPGAHQVIGDRAFSAEPDEIARLGAACIAGLQAAGCIPVIKHIPGHGRALADSHHELPRVAVDAAALAADIAPFQALAGSGAWAMTAHVLYEKLDPDKCATQSKKIIHGIIRKYIKFRGILMSDDICMKALSGGIVKNAKLSLDAGCNLLLHCSGKMDEMKKLSLVVPEIDNFTYRITQKVKANFNKFN